MSSKPRIVFMGTPDFAVPSLQALLDHDYPIDLVVTQPDRPAGRGKKLTVPPIKELALSHGIEVFQPESLKKNPKEREAILKRRFDYLVVVAFGQILPKDILDAPTKAPLNVHASLLPAYRGAAPIARAIHEGEDKTGVTIQKMVEELDLGDILVQLPCPIHDDDNSLTLHDRLKHLGAQALTQCLELYELNRIKAVPQDPRIGTYASKLSKDEAAIDFSKNAFSVHRKVMALNPWPVAECQFVGQRLRIFRSEFVARESSGEPGSVIEVLDDRVIVGCGHGCLALLEVQLEGKKRVSMKDFLNAREVPEGLILGGKG